MSSAAPNAVEVRAALRGDLSRTIAAPQIRDYELLELAGRGDFAEVWKVRDHRDGRLFALKQLRPDCINPPAAIRLLENEATVGARVESPHIVQVITPRHNARPNSVLLEWLDGETLEDRLARSPRLTCRQALWIARQCAQGMHDLLAAGFAHGDVKPSNIFLCRDGIAKLIDLGFARLDRPAPLDLADVPAPSISGTPDYMAPETLAAGEIAGVARDLYSLGVTLHRMLTGTLPFQGATIGEVLRQQQQALPRRVRTAAPHLPARVETLVARLLSKQPLRRGGGLGWLIGELVAIELALLVEDVSESA